MKKTLSSLLFLVSACGIHAEDWPQWRGPHFTGATSDSSQCIDFSTTKNVKWSRNLPGPSGATPIIYGDKVFISSVNESKEQLLGICLDRHSGKVLWEKDLGSGYRPNNEGTKIAIGVRSNYASPSPVTDGKTVIFYYGNGDIIGLDMNGQEKWRKNIQKEYGDFCYQWTFSASPSLIGGKLLLPVLQRDAQAHDRGDATAGSYILCLEPDTGKQLWKHQRPSKAIVESLESYATIVPYDRNGSKEFVVFGADAVTSHQLDTGKETWRWGTWNPNHEQQWWRTVPSPVIGNNTVLICAPKKEPVYAVDLTSKADSESMAGMIWNSDGDRDISSDVPTPLFYKGHFYILNDLRKVLVKVEEKTGKTLWSTKLPSTKKWRGSPTASDDKIFLLNHGGLVVILDANSGEILRNIEMGEAKEDNVRSSIPIVDNQLFIRTNTKIYCIEKSDKS